ncbi:MAG TPA: hypothetical protein VF629_24580 [Hymenobacter sp.]|uniref:hypothetical protein n=1 Tax=Hymenobacter sp. TaxID=1898978 RepID=UPI002ED9C867
MKHFPLRASLLALPLLALSCEKPPPEPDAVPLPAELKSYVLFQPGTQWVYRDSATQQLDSVWVVSTEMSEVRLVLKGKSYPFLKHEDFRMRTRSSRGGPDLVYGVARYCSLPGGEDAGSKGPCWYVTRAQVLPNSTADEGGADVFPYLIPREQAGGFLNVNNAVMYPYWHVRPLTVGGQAYPSVLEVRLTADASEGGWPAYYAWAPGVGIVRQRVRVRFVPYTRTLVRSRIVQ